MLKNLLPEDTRIAELGSAISIIFMSFLLSSGQITSIHYNTMSFVHTEEFWTVIFFSFGFTQLVSLIFYLHLELLRCISALICSCILIWISLDTIVWTIQLTDITTFLLGIFNLYAFIINSSQIGYKWVK